MACVVKFLCLLWVGTVHFLWLEGSAKWVRRLGATPCNATPRAPQYAPTWQNRCSCTGARTVWWLVGPGLASTHRSTDGPAQGVCRYRFPCVSFYWYPRAAGRAVPHAAVPSILKPVVRACRGRVACVPRVSGALPHCCLCVRCLCAFRSSSQPAGATRAAGGLPLSPVGGAIVDSAYGCTICTRGMSSVQA